jgi:hypothetical protein
MKLEKSAKWVLPGSERVGRKGGEEEAGRRNDPNNVCTCE